MPSILACPSCDTKYRVGPIPRGTPRCTSCDAALPWIVKADESSFAAESEASVPVLVDFWAPKARLAGRLEALEQDRS